jgi:hypothetical protein
MCLNIYTNAFPTILSVAVIAHVTLFTMTAMFSRDVKSADDYVTIHKMADPYRGRVQSTLCFPLLRLFTGAHSTLLYWNSFFSFFLIITLGRLIHMLPRPPCHLVLILVGYLASATWHDFW